MKKCKVCKKPFQPIRSTLEPVCDNYNCKVAFAIQHAKKIKEKKAKEWRKEKAVLKDKIKTLSECEADAKKSFQKFIRLRDQDLPCISCGGNYKNLWDGGHFKKAEIYSGVIFHEMNCHKQCRKCNRFLNGNELMYREGLISRYSEDFVRQIESLANETRQYKWTKEQLIAKKIQYDLKIKDLINKKC
jgi:seryl-tRNA synthetase